MKDVTHNMTDSVAVTLTNDQKVDEKRRVVEA
jgi:hypothetical protein